ncbi:MAG: Na+/H+ antiporter subunit D [Deltaproteobacteria bacterium]|nr:Na+/H+ antiporter subunit D [Deltaproteobacteria bacterium]
MTQLLFLPLLIPLATAIAGLFAWNRREFQRLLGVVGTAALLGAGMALFAAVRAEGVVSVQAGDWAAPFGITLVADLFSAVMVVTAGAMGLAVAVYSLGDPETGQEALGYHPLLQVLLLGVCGSLLTGDLFNLYVWFEVMLIASFVLLALGGRRSHMEGAIKYVALNLIASAFFLAGIGILYGVAGTLNLADLARQLRAGPHAGPVPVVAALLFAAFGIKAAIFPLFFWLPASYHTPPVAVTTLFSALLTKVGVYVLIRIFTLLFVQEAEAGRTFLLAAAGLTMVSGVLGAVTQHEIRRLLSFHIVSQIGYLVLGLGLLTPLALAGTIFFMVHVIAAKSALFLVGGIVKRLTGTSELAELGGLYEGRPLVAALFLVPALALAGVPPLSGFWAKLALLRAGLETGHYVVVAAALGVSLLTLFSMTKIWAEAFWKDRPASGGEPRAHRPPSLSQRERLLLGAPAAALALVTVVLGVGAEPFFRVALDAARQLLTPELYIATVLGVTP